VPKTKNWVKQKLEKKCFWCRSTQSCRTKPRAVGSQKIFATGGLAEAEAKIRLRGGRLTGESGHTQVASVCAEIETSRRNNGMVRGNFRVAWMGLKKRGIGHVVIPSSTRSSALGGRRSCRWMTGGSGKNAANRYEIIDLQSTKKAISEIRAQKNRERDYNKETKEENLR